MLMADIDAAAANDNSATKILAAPPARVLPCFNAVAAHACDSGHGERRVVHLDNRESNPPLPYPLATTPEPDLQMGRRW